MNEEQEMMLRCYNAMGHGHKEAERLEAAKLLYEWLKTASKPVQ